MISAHTAAPVPTLEIHKAFVLHEAVSGAQEAAVLRRHRIPFWSRRGSYRLSVEHRHLSSSRRIILAVGRVLQEVVLRILAPDTNEVGARGIDSGEGVIAAGLAEMLVEVEGADLAELVS